MPDPEVPLTPEQQIAKLQSELDQAKSAQTQAEAKAKKSAPYARALKALQDASPEWFAFAEARAFDRPATPPVVRPVSATPTATPTTEPLDDLQRLKQEILDAIDQRSTLMEQKIETTNRRLDGVRADQLHRSVREQHPDYDQHEAKIQELLERHPSLAASPEGLDIAAHYIKRATLRETVKQETLAEIEGRETEARANFMPEPMATTAPDFDPGKFMAEGETVHRGLDRLFGDRR